MDMPRQPGSPFEPFTSAHKFQHMTRTINRKTHARGDSNGAGGVIAGDSLYVADLTVLQQGRVAGLESNRSGTMLLVNGTYEYCDELATYSCKDFSILYQGDPYRRFSLATLSDCRWPYFSTLPPLKDPDVEYLLPCRTAHEREQEDKEIAGRMKQTKAERR
jgi:hypothetical protein